MNSEPDSVPSRPSLIVRTLAGASEPRPGGGPPRERPPRRRGLGLAVPLLVLASACALLTLIGYRSYEGQRRSIEAATRRTLGAIADLKASQVVQWTRARTADARILSRGSGIRRELGPWLARGAPDDAERKIIVWQLSTYRDVYGYVDIQVLDEALSVQLTLRPELPHDRIERHFPREVLRGTEVTFSEIYRDETDPTHPLYLDVYAPLIADGAERPFGGIVLRIDPRRVLFPLVQSWPVPSDSAEALLVRRDGDDVLFLTELRHAPAAPLTLRKPLGSPDLLAARALRGEAKDPIAAVDYRGMPVVAAARPVSGSSWTLLVKVDRSEVDAPEKERERFVTTLLLGIVVLAAIVMALWWQQRIRSYVRWHEAELERRALLRHFEYLSKNANDIIVLSDKDGRIAEANDRAAQAYGYPRDELLELRAHDLRCDSQSLTYEDSWQRMERDGGLFIEMRHRRKDGTTFPVEVSARLFEIDGRRYAQAIIRDVTQRRALEAELRAAERRVREVNEALEQRVRERTAQLEAALRELEAFSYSVSHDLRAPLRSIDGFSQAILEDYEDKLDEAGKNYLRRVRAASQRMAQLIDDLLQLSRISRNEVTIEAVDLSAMARDVLDVLRQTAPERDVTTVVADGIIVQGDARMLRVAMENLLGNAWKYTSKKASATIEFGSAVEDDKTTYFVRDDGAGFDMAYANKLFAPFQRLHSPNEFEGTGIGLANVQRVLRRHGGEIWAEGVVDGGATFRFRLWA